MTTTNSDEKPDNSTASAEQGLPVEAPYDSPDSNEDLEKNSSSETRQGKLSWIAVIFILVGLIATAVTIPTVLLTRDGASKSTDNDPDKPADDIDGLSRSYLRAEGPVFNTTIPLFDTNVARSYTSESQFRNDLTEVCKYLVNHIVQQNIVNWGTQPPGSAPTGRPPAPTAPTTSTSGPQEDASGPASPSAEGATDFETNNQEKGVDEGDLIKSDGLFVYAAFGDSVKVWNATSGELTGSYKLPPLESFNGRRKTLSEPAYYYGPSIQSLLLNSNRLVVIANGYGYEQQQALGYSYDVNPPAFQELLSTNVRVYETTATGQLTFLKEVHVNGYFSEARSIANNAHIVTFSWFNYYQFFYEPLSRYQPDLAGLSDEEYVTQAGLLATNELIPIFADTVVRDMSINTNELPDLARIALWQTTVSNSSDFESYIHGGTIVDGFAQVVSLDMTDDASRDVVDVTLSGALMPSGWGYTYATDEFIAIMGQGWDFHPELSGSIETTYLLCLRLDGASSTPAAVGMAPGHVIDQFAVDIHSGYFRIATTIRNFQPFIAQEPGGMPVTSMPPPTPETQNQVIILEIPDFDGSESTLVEVGRISDLGRPREVFTAVRFFDNIAYAVTYERKDPFYVMDLGDPFDPVVLGELNVTGFSSYLHSINVDNTLTLAVGEEADENGLPLGMQISLFDSRDPADPQLLQRLVISNQDSWPSSSVQWDHRAFRYLSLDTTDPATGNVVIQGILIIPLQIWASDVQDNFDGFYTYDVSVDGIQERFNIAHSSRYVHEVYGGCGPMAWLAERSFVFDGSVTTTKGISVVHTDLDSGEREWMLLFNETDSGGSMGSPCYVD